MAVVRLIHRWCGIVLAALIVVIALSGALSAFRGDIVRAALPAARGPTASPESFGPALDAFAAANPDNLLSVKLAPFGLATHAALLNGGTRAWIDADGNAVESWSGTRGLGNWALQLHHKLLIGDIGEVVTGIVGVAGLGMVLTGLVLYWPARRGFAWRLWPASGRRPALLKSHRNLAVLLAIPLLVQFGSGAVMVFNRELSDLFGTTAPAAPLVAPDTPKASWSDIITAARAAAPGGAVRGVWAPRTPDKPYSVSIQQANDINPEGTTRILVAGGKVVQVYDPAQQGGAAQFLSQQLGLHTAAYFGGLTAQLLLASLGILLATVALLGLFSWLRAPQRRTVAR